MTGTYTTKTNPTRKSPCGCGGTATGTSDKPCGCGCGCHHEHCDTPCCTDVCFERPNYFCGHLLTDDDLTIGVRYVREKNKLYHRGLHGSGIVCGLSMRRDFDCPANVLVSEGFAIDRCGNDLVVCEQRSFNILAALRQKGYLINEEGDPCDERRDDDDDCVVKRCFWVVARYAEEPCEFESPLESACSPGPGSCLPTRIRETVSFDVLDCPPEHQGALERLIERFECCFRVLVEGNFAQTVKANQAPLKALFDESYEGGNTDYFSIFSQLKAYFLQHIRRSPDPYDATLEGKVRAAPAPGRHTGGTGYMQTPKAEKDQHTADGPPVAKERFTDVDEITPRESICGLFGHVWRYITDCLYAALTFPCPAPKCGGEVVLGTVDIVNGKLARICHCGREYVWAAANFWQVLVAYLVESAGCRRPEQPSLQNRDQAAAEKYEERERCCPEIDLNCEKFFTLYLQNQRAPQAAVLETLGMLPGLADAARNTFNFLDPNVVSPAVFQSLSEQDAKTLAQKLGLTLQLTPAAQVNTAASPFQEIAARMLARPGDTITAQLSKDGVAPVSVSPASALEAVTAMQQQASTTQKAVDANTAQIQQIAASSAKAKDLDAATALIQELSASLQTRDATLASLNAQLASLTTRIALLEKPSAPPAAPTEPAQGGQGD